MPGDACFSPVNRDSVFATLRVDWREAKDIRLFQSRKPGFSFCDSQDFGFDTGGRVESFSPVNRDSVFATLLKIGAGRIQP